MLPSSGARRSLASVGCTYRTRVVSSPHLCKLAHRQVIEALSTRSSSAALLGYLAADYLPTGADLSTLAGAGAALLAAHAARPAAHAALLACLTFAALLPADAPPSPGGADPFARAVAGAALLSAGAARLASRKPPSSALLTGLIAHPWKCTDSPWPLQQKA